MRTITNANEIDGIFRQGVRAAGGTVTLIISRTPEARGSDGRVLFVAGKRLGGAVLRNRCKRVLRAAVSRCGGPWPGWDVVLMARAATPTAPHDELDRGIKAGLRRAGVIDR
ncbi:MAG: ribonuclease P protein component [Coriobacteriia bacterium]|nr:ribonuclease P protein component [Coriobacteriia bacterium]MBN2841048.1 ribonuclease P protein component [Coriobacteriia bacterium]